MGIELNSYFDTLSIELCCGIECRERILFWNDQFVVLVRNVAFDASFVDQIGYNAMCFIDCDFSFTHILQGNEEMVEIQLMSLSDEPNLRKFKRNIH